MSASGAGNGGQLIPGLPEDLVLFHVVSRLPWHTRPRCRALSTKWRTVLDTENPELDRQTRMIQVPLLRGLFLLFTFDKQIFIEDHDIHEPQRINGYQIQRHWRKLPRWTGLVAPMARDVTVVARSGMVYVWSCCRYWEPNNSKFVLKLDMGCAGWTWKKILVPYAFTFEAVSFNDKIYVPDTEGYLNYVIMHDMTTDMCRQVETWNHANLRVVSDVGIEELYSVVDYNLNGKIEVLVYDGHSDSWKTLQELPIVDDQWAYGHKGLIKLLNNDSFEPASGMGINIVWYHYYGGLVHWFNSCAGATWVDIRSFPLLKGGRSVENVTFIHGSMYGFFCDEQQEQEKDTQKDEEGGGYLRSLKRTLMKGTIDVESSCVVWEEVLEIGFFKNIYCVDTVYYPPILCITMMA